MSVPFDRIISSSPLNSTAARVTSSGGDHYDPDVNFATNLHWDAPPRTAPMPTASTFVDLTGARFGRFTVVGYLGKLNPKKKALWLVRCACGDYEARHAAAICSPLQTHAKCRKCLHWVSAKLRYEREGSKPLSDFINKSEVSA